MDKKMILGGAALLALALAACGGQAGAPGGGQTVVMPMGHGLVIEAAMPKDTIGEELPGEGLYTVQPAPWKAELGGMTQQTRSQALGFPPGTKLTIRNLSKQYTHTLDVVKVIKGPPAVFPRNITLRKEGAGNRMLEAGYASGPIKPGHAVTVTLAKAGIYLIGCAYHYPYMHDVIVVESRATPGPQATATPAGGGSGSSGSGW